MAARPEPPPSAAPEVPPVPALDTGKGAPMPPPLEVAPAAPVEVEAPASPIAAPGLSLEPRSLEHAASSTTAPNGSQLRSNRIQGRQRDIANGRTALEPTRATTRRRSLEPVTERGSDELFAKLGSEARRAPDFWLCCRAGFPLQQPGEVVMSYAQGRVFRDADSHVMELPDFLNLYAEPGEHAQLPTIRVDAPRLQQGLLDATVRRSHPPEYVRELIALGDDLISGPKGYLALGAFNGSERSQALDLLGFSQQLVFATFSAGIAFSEQRPLPQRYAIARAHNRAMAEFCANDRRLFGVGLLPLDDLAATLIELAHVQTLGLRAVWVPHRPCGGRSPGHDDLEPLWARLAEAGLPFLLHVGGRPLQIAPAWMNTGRAVPTDWLGGGENVRGKDMTSLHHEAETFLGTLILDGVLERHPTLRGGVIELGAGWVPSMLRRLDWITEIWRKSEPDLKALKRRPSEQASEQLAFTPYPYEDVGDLIRHSDSRLYMFSSDYPHVEGGRNPLGRFEASLAGCDEASRERFYNENFARLFSLA
jgi:uncharacterized protein